MMKTSFHVPFYVHGQLFIRFLEKRFHCVGPRFAGSLEILESTNGEKFLDEQLRVQDGNVGRTAYERVGRVGKGVVDVVTDEGDVGIPRHRLEQTVDHVPIGAT